MYDYTKLPEHIRHGVKIYIEHGIEPGDFLTAVISNDLKGSFAVADEINRDRLFDIVSFFYNEAPMDCWGSRERMAAWIKHSGLAGWAVGATI